MDVEVEAVIFSGCLSELGSQWPWLWRARITTGSLMLGC